MDYITIGYATYFHLWRVAVRMQFLSNACMQFSFFVKVFRLSVVEYPTTKKSKKKARTG